MFYIMLKIRSQRQMINYQQQILIGLNNDPKFLKLKLSFFNDPDLHKYSKVFFYIYNYIKK